MGGFKRFCTFIYSLAGLLCLAALGLTWIGPWTDQACALFSNDWYFMTVEVLAAILAVGLIISLFRSIFSRQVKNVEITNVDGGTISVSRDAIASQAKHIVESDGTCSAERVYVSAKKRGHVRVHVRVLPHESVDVVQKGEQLHEELVSGLASVCGDKLEDVSLEFVVPQEVTSTTSGDSEVSVEPTSWSSYDDYAAPATEQTTIEPTTLESSAETQVIPAETTASVSPDTTSGITVPMGVSRDATTESDESKEA